jgi:hypothetical protein
VDVGRPSRAFVTVAAPSFGCEPVAYALSYAKISVGSPPASPQVLDVAALLHGALSYPLDLDAGANYTLTVAGTCADGSKTPESQAVTFTTSKASPTVTPPPTPTLVSTPTPVVAFVVNNGAVSACDIVSGSPSTLSNCVNVGPNSWGGIPTTVNIVGSTAFVGLMMGSYGAVACTVSGSTLLNCVPSGYAGMPPSIANVGPTAFVSTGFVKACTIVSGAPSTLSSCGTTGTGISNAAGIAIVGSTAFVVMYVSPGGTVHACTVSGSTLLNCVDSGGSGFNGAMGIAIVGSTAFVTNFNGNTVSACTIVSGTPSTLLNCVNSFGTGFNGPRSIAIAGSTAFVANSGVVGGNSAVSACTIVSGTPSTLSNCVYSGDSGFGLTYDIALA